MFKSAVFFVLLVAAAQARDLQQDDAEKADSKVALGWSCRRTQFPPKMGCNFECPESTCAAPGRKCVNDESDCQCRPEDGVILTANGKCQCLRQQFPVKEGCNFVCPPNSCIRPRRRCVDSIEDCMCNIHLGYKMNAETSKCEKVPEFTADFENDSEPPTLTCPKGEGLALDAEAQKCVKTLDRRAFAGCNATFTLARVDGSMRCLKEDVKAAVPLCEAGFTAVTLPEKGVTCEKKEYKDAKFNCPGGYKQEVAEDGTVSCMASANEDPVMSCDKGFVIDASGKRCTFTVEEPAEASCEDGYFMATVASGVACVQQWW